MTVPAETVDATLGDKKRKRNCWSAGYALSMNATSVTTDRHAAYYDVITRRDAAWNGRFFTGVLTTGIYCLPSCAARTPKIDNVRFFRTVEDAESYGLRPCKRCRPQMLGAFEEEGRLQRLMGRLRSQPTEIRGVPELAEAMECGVTKLNAISHLTYHAAPAHLMAMFRIEWSMQRLRLGDEAGSVGIASGYESLSGFYEQFRRFTGMAPGEYRELGRAPGFRMSWPDGFDLSAWRGYIGRDPDSVCERVTANGALIAAHVRDRPTLIRIGFDTDGVTVDANADPFDVHAIVVRMLGYAQDLDNSAAKLACLLPHGTSVRIPQTVSVWDALVWGVLGQQVNVPFASRLRSRLAALAGSNVGAGMSTIPSPASMANLTHLDLAPIQFSERKSDYLIGLAREIASGQWNPERLPKEPASLAERELLGRRGVGPWAANYVLMRGCGFLDAVPLGDTGLATALQRCFGLPGRPDGSQTAALMKQFAPYRSLATYHLWHSLKEGI